MIWALLTASAAEVPTDPDAPMQLHVRGRRTEKHFLSVLGAWGVANLVGGTVGALTTKNPRLQSFYATNAAWNTVNIGLAVAGFLPKRNPDLSSWSVVEQRHRKLHKILSINIGADVVYVVSGITVMVLGGQLESAPLRGAGQAIFLQGTFLTVFDLVFLDGHKSVGRRVRLGVVGNGIGGVF